MNIASVIGQHRVGSNSFFGTFYGHGGRKIQCQCGWISVAYYGEQTSPIDGEYNPERETQRRHAEHVSEVLQDAERETLRKHAAHASQMLQEAQRVQEIAREEIGYRPSKPSLRTVQRSTSVKYQVSAYAREYMNEEVAHLLRAAAQEIAKHEEIPNQIKIDRAPVTGGEKITVTWFA